MVIIMIMSKNPYYLSSVAANQDEVVNSSHNHRSKVVDFVRRNGLLRPLDI